MFTGKWFPFFRRGLFEPLYYVKNRSPFLSYWKELEKTQYLPEYELKKRQWQKMEIMLRYVSENNDYYRTSFQNAEITPEMIHSPEDLRIIPILTKHQIRKNTTAMISRDFSIDGLLHFKTGGSTGKSLDIHLTEECSEMRNACARRHDRWSGWEVGEPRAAVWGNPHLPVSLKEKLKNNLISPFMYLDTMCVTEESVRKFAAEWQRVKPTVLFGHAHSIYILAQLIRDLNITNVKPLGILSTSMMLMPHERKLIEDVFDVKVTDRYGCEEVSLIASECEKHEGMHLNIEHLYIEFIREDGTPAASGEPGKIVVTDLMNRAMPFIRYQVEDVGVPTDRKCSCGRGLPLMESLTGRVADFLIKQDGSKVAGVSLIENTLTYFPGLDQMQLVQESIDRITVRLVKGEGYGKEIEADLVKYFTGIFGVSVKVEVELVDAILPEPSGKYRFSICKI